MNIKFFYLTLIVFMSIATYGQSFEQSDRVIIKLKNEVNPSNPKLNSQSLTGNYKVDRVSQKFKAIKIKKQSTGNITNPFFYIIQFPEETNIHQAIDAYYKTNEIIYAEPDYKGSGGGMLGYIPNDYHYSRQWGLKNHGIFPLSPSIAGADINMENAWNIEQGKSKIIVAIIDSGIKLNHPEFTGRIWNNSLEIPNNGIDDDENGYIDDMKGWDFANQDNDPTDDMGHGTNVAGIIGANGDNSIGFAGVDWNCRLMILKGLDNENNGYYSWWAQAIYYAVDNGAKVINMSLGGAGISATLQNAVSYAITNNVTVVACMMNTNSSIIYYPAGIPDVIAVGSTNPDDTRSAPFFWSPTSGSNFGNHISVVAPGNFIFGLNYQSNVDYTTYWGGTSQATPLVSGLVSLLLAQDSDRTPAELKSILETTATDQVGNINEDAPGWDPYYGFGRIDAFKALSHSTSSSSVNVQNNNISIYPNPFSQQTTLQIENSLINATLTIYNSHGQIVEQKQIINSQPVTIYRNNLPKGLYFMCIAKDGVVIMTDEIIISD